MWRPWSKALEAFGRLRLRAPFRWRTTVAVGDPSAPDAEGGFGWREYVDAERLYDVWGPHPESVWTAYHTVPLFAAIDSLKRDAIGPAPPPEAMRAESISPPADTPAGTPATPDGAPPPPAAPGGPLAHPVPGDPAPAWVRRDTWTIVDLPGPLAVRAAAWLVTGTGCQPVCTFDNWPHARGVLKAEHTLAELLRWATTVARVRPVLDASSPPLWVCDSDRLGAAAPRPREFDNRYYLDDSILPGAAVLREAGIHRAIYVTRSGDEAPVADLDECFKELMAAGIGVLRVGVFTPEREPVPLVTPAAPRKRPRGFRRSSAGGFGQTVPDPSSGSSG